MTLQEKLAALAEHHEGIAKSIRTTLDALNGHDTLRAKKTFSATVAAAVRHSKRSKSGDETWSQDETRKKRGRPRKKQDGGERTYSKGTELIMKLAKEGGPVSKDQIYAELRKHKVPIMGAMAMPMRMGLITKDKDGMYHYAGE